jgi:phage baseplate assembly protein W
VRRWTAIKTLALVNGDLWVTQGGYKLITGVDRIRQDLMLALLEEYGSDRFHPRWGSIVKRYIGNVITPQLEALVRAEVNRIVQNYILIQQAEVIRDTQIDEKGRFTTSDVVRSLLNLSTSVGMGSVNVSLALETLARSTVTIKRQVVV